MRHRAALFVAALAFAFPSLAGADGCQVISVGLDTTGANQPIPDFYSNQASQVFAAPDTILTAITVWQSPSSPYLVRGKLYVMEVDTLGGIVKPDEKKLLLDGPTLEVPGGDGIHPTPISWLLDPPLILPRRGQFAFEIAPLPCGGGSSNLFLGHSGDPYSEGSFWSFDTGNCGLDAARTIHWKARSISRFAPTSASCPWPRGPRPGAC